jgi:polar amino acid transport system substrate-binding protein
VIARAVVSLAAPLAAMLVAAGCASPSAPPSPVTIGPVDPRPFGVREVTAVPGTDNEDCGREASLRPGPLPLPGAMPSNSTMAAIFQRGRLIVGVDQDTNLFGFRNPATGQLEGFDIDVAREIARAIFGDPNRIDLRVVDANQRESILESGAVDLVVRTYSITCERKQKVGFSTVYYYADQKILAVKGSGIDSAAKLGGKRVCAVSGTTSLARLAGLDPKPTVLSASTWTDCLVMLQQGQIDAISTDDSVLAGLKQQDPNVEIGAADIGKEPYGIGVNKQSEDLIRFVNGVLERMRVDGTWQRLYRVWLQSLGASPGPPIPEYQE